MRNLKSLTQNILNREKKLKTKESRGKENTAKFNLII